MRTPPKATDLRGLRLTNKQLVYLAHLKMCVPSRDLIQKSFHSEFGRTISKTYITNMSHYKKARNALEKVKEQYEKNVGFEFFSAKINRVRALTELYDKATLKDQLGICHDIIKTFNDMFDPKKDGDNIYVQNNEYINMTVPELKHEIRLLSKKLGPELLRITAPENE